MASANKANTIRCPYMPEHVMGIDSLLTHLNRCKATNKHLFRTCQFNSLHIVPKDHYHEHVEVCEDGMKFQAENAEDGWAEKERRKKQMMNQNINLTNKSDSNCSSSHSSDFEFLDGSSEQDNGYGYYDYFDYDNYSMRNEPNREQYDDIDVQHHSASFYKDKHLSYLAPASMTIPKKQKKEKIKVNVTNVCPNTQPKSVVERNLNKSSINPFKKQEKPVIIVGSDRETVENSLSIENKKKIKNKIEDEDDEILILIKEIESKKEEIREDSHDEFGDALIEQAIMLKQKRHNNIGNNSMLSMH